MNLKAIIAALLLAAIAAGCRNGTFPTQNAIPTSLAEVSAVRLNYRYEPDVPGPEQAARAAEERVPAVQADFDQARPGEVLDKTILSPDKKRILAVYHQPADIQAEFRLDMYTGDGKLLRKITPDTMAVHFPDTIVWSPDSSTVAFVGMIRAGQGEVSAPTPPGIPGPENANTTANTTVNANANTDANAQAANANIENTEAAPPENTNTAPTPAAPVGVLTFRSEQIYICDLDGDKTKPLTQNEGLIYFYYIWSPDGTMLAALAATAREWQYLQYQADAKAEAFTPMGRPRIVEKNGRERRLDDALTAVQPVWSPDSSKVADAFDTQVRIYDAVGNNPTQAAIPLRNQLLLSSQAYDRDQQSRLADGNNTNGTSANSAAPTPAADQGATTLPDERSLVSFNPIVDLEWTADDILYLQTAYVKRMKNDADSVTSFARWHRLVLTAQASVLQ
jgi:hypothetical protein